MEPRKTIVLFIFDNMNVSYAVKLKEYVDTHTEIYAITLANTKWYGDTLITDEAYVMNGKSLIDIVDTVIVFTNNDIVDINIYTLMCYAIEQNKTVLSTTHYKPIKLFNSIKAIKTQDSYNMRRSFPEDIDIELYEIVPSFSANLIWDESKFNNQVCMAIQERIRKEHPNAFIKIFVDDECFEEVPLSDITLVYNKSDHSNMDLVDRYIDKVRMIGDENNKLYGTELYPGVSNIATTILGGYYFEYSI